MIISEKNINVTLKCHIRTGSVNGTGKNAQRKIYSIRIAVWNGP